MPLPNHLGAYDDCVELWDKALSGGARALLKSRGEASMLILRLNTCRRLLREQSKALYARDDPRWNTSDYDRLVTRLKESAEADGTWWVYIERYGSNILAIETLEEENESGDPESVD